MNQKTPNLTSNEYKDYGVPSGGIPRRKNLDVNNSQDEITKAGIGSIAFGPLIENTKHWPTNSALMFNTNQSKSDTKKHNHYFKNVKHLEYIDVYRVLDLFEVTNPSIQHAIKKLLVAGGRGTKDTNKDIQEAIDSLIRYQEMVSEDYPHA